MNTNRPNDETQREDPAGQAGRRHPSDPISKWLDTALNSGGAGPQHQSDPIARNPKDVDRPEEATQAIEPRRSEGIPAIAVSTTRLQNPAWAVSQHAQTPPSAIDLLKSVLHFKWTLILIFILVSAPIVAFVWTQIVPLYQARAEIRVRPIIPQLVFRTDENGAIPFYDSFVNTQVSLIRSLTVLQRVLDRPDIQKTQWYGTPPETLVQRLQGTTTPPIERLRDSLSVTPRPRTEIIDISFTDTSAADARLIVDAVLEQYIKYVGEKSDATKDALYRQLVDQNRALEIEIASLETSCASLRKMLGTETPQELVSGQRVRLDAIQARLSDLRNSIAVLEWDMKQTSASDSNGVPTAVSSAIERQRRYYEDAEWLRLDSAMRTIQHEIDVGVQGPNHPAKIRLAKDLQDAQDRLKRREGQLDELYQDRLRSMAIAPGAAADPNGPRLPEAAAPIEYQLARAKHEEQLLQADLAKQQAEFEKLFESAQQLAKEINGLQQKRVLYDAVRQRLEQKNVERNVPGSIEVSMRAYSPSKPEKDRRVVFTAMTLFLGLGLGGGAAFLRASRDQAIYAAKDMPQPMQAPFLGYVPLVHISKRPGRSLSDELEQNQYLLIESVRVLRTTLLSRLDHHGSATILVTSANEGTGKSSFTMMLGKSIAQAGRRVLLIDADLHKMTLSKRFDLLDKPGFRESMRDKIVDKLCIFPTETSGLDVIPAGKRGGDNSTTAFEEIANGAFRTCLAQLLEQHSYDIVLLDSPPILPVADAVILAGQVDGTIMVEREHVSRRTDVANALVRLGSAGGHLLGTVFVGSGRHDEYGYGYGYAYDYGHRGNGAKKS